MLRSWSSIFTLKGNEFFPIIVKWLYVSRRTMMAEQVDLLSLNCWTNCLFVVVNYKRTEDLYVITTRSDVSSLIH